MLWRAVNIVMALNFLFSAALQYNDPDPLRWIAIYALAGAISAAAALRPPGFRWYVPAFACAAAAAWSLTLLPHVAGRFAFGDLFQSWEMKAAVVEEAREMLGLLVIAAWMLVLTVARALGRPRPAGHAAPEVQAPLR